MNSSTITEDILKLPALYQKQVIYRATNVYFKYEQYLSYYALVLLIVGTICNTFSIVIMMRKSLRKYACMRYLCALAFSDLIVLYQWNLNTFFKYNLSRPPFYFDLEELSILLCKLIAFLAFTSLQSSAWLLSLVSFDRLMMIYTTFWKHQMHSPLRLNLMIASVFGTIALLNSHLIVNNGYVIDLTRESALLMNYSSANETKLLIPTRAVNCYRSLNDAQYVFPKWQTANMFLYSILPFSIMFVCNLLIIYNVKFARSIKSQAKKAESRKRKMTMMLLLVTFSFIILTFPSVIVHTFLRDFLKKKPYRRLVNMLVNHSLHTSHAINFFLYAYSAPLFRNEIIKIFQTLKVLFVGRQVNKMKNDELMHTGCAENKKLMPPTNNDLQPNSIKTSTESNSFEMIEIK